MSFATDPSLPCTEHSAHHGVSGWARLHLRWNARTFHPWGMNYGKSGRLMEDFWDSDWLKLFVRLKPEFCPETTGGNGRSGDAFP
jgi:hypothetical protein